MLEVEFKASLEGIPEAQLEKSWRALGFLPGNCLREVDSYYNGTHRDFRKTDEALRLRSCTQLPHGPTEILLTYKGPKLDDISCARKEYEVAVSDGETAQQLLEALGYHRAFTVDKTRQELHLGEVTLCLDQVAGLGSYLELELLVPEGQREAAETRLLFFLDRLGISRDRLTRTSYLELLAQKEG